MGQYFYAKVDNKEHKIFLQSDVTKLDLEEEYIVGIDEAGRGPVLGPLVYSCAFYPISKLQRLKAMGFQDSKKLTEFKRWKLFNDIQKENVGYQVNIISPLDISEQFFSYEKVSLNKVSHDRTFELLEHLLFTLHLKVNAVYIDTVGKAETYQTTLQHKFPEIPNITVAIKADSKYEIVSAASIIAKVIRDLLLQEWVFPELISFPSPSPSTSSAHYHNSGNDGDDDDDGEEKHEKQRVNEYSKEYGCGYPGDQITKGWLASSYDMVFGYPSVVRFSWKTTENELKKRACPVIWDPPPTLSVGSKRKSMDHPSSSSSFGGADDLYNYSRSSYFITRGMNITTQL